MKKYFQACRFSISSAIASDIFMQINRILTKLCQLKQGVRQVYLVVYCIFG